MFFEWHLFQFYHDTVSLYGTLEWIKPLIKEVDIISAVHIGACNIYHACIHNAVHEKSTEILKSLLKSTVFVIQAKYYLENNTYLRKRAELMPKLEGQDKQILNAIINGDIQNNFDEVSQFLMDWSSTLIKEYNR